MLFPLFIKRWFRSFDLHTRSLTNRFVCNFLSSSAGFNLCSCFFPARPCLSAYFGLPLSRPVAASASLSDPRCFRVLSTASVLGSDYSASVSSFPCFLTPPHSGFLSAPLLLSLLRSSPFSPAWFPVHSLPVLVLSFAVCFLSPFPVSLPQPFHWCFPFGSLLGDQRLTSAASRFRFSISLLSLCFFLSAIPASASQWLPQFPSPLSLPRFPLSPRPDLSCLPSRFSYSASCSFPFVLPRFAPTAVPRVLALRLRLRPFPFPSGFFRPRPFRF